MKFPPVKPVEDADLKFPVLFFPYKSSRQVMMKEDTDTMIYESGRQEESTRENDVPYDVYGRANEYDDMIADDIDMEGNANNRANMLLGLDTGLERSMLLEASSRDSLNFMLRSAKAQGYLGLIIRPFDGKFGDAEYMMQEALPVKSKPKVADDDDD